MKLHTPKPITEDEAKALIERWRQSKTGAEIHRIWTALQEKLKENK